LYAQTHSGSRTSFATDTLLALGAARSRASPHWERLPHIATAFALRVPNVLTHRVCLCMYCLGNFSPRPCCCRHRSAHRVCTSYFIVDAPMLQLHRCTLYINLLRSAPIDPTPCIVSNTEKKPTLDLPPCYAQTPLMRQCINLLRAAPFHLRKPSTFCLSLLAGPIAILRCFLTRSSLSVASLPFLTLPFSHFSQKQDTSRCHGYFIIS